MKINLKYDVVWLANIVIVEEEFMWMEEKEEGEDGRYYYFSTIFLNIFWFSKKWDEEEE